MPAYGYDCDSCGPFEASRPIAEAGAPHGCPECGELAPRVLARPHVRTSWAGIRYIAEARNEKSAHEPMTEHRLKGTTEKHRQAHTHAHHGHGHTHGRTRPWMIGH
jgi:putative FmdB family regulatory protein